MTGVPPIHLINLDRSTDRLQRFHEINGHLDEVRRVSAADGSTLDRQALIASGYITEDLPYPAGTLGCALSHVRLWEMAATENRSITILEDDAVVSCRFGNIACDVLSALPMDWDIVHWGCALNPLFAWVDLGVSRVRLHAYGHRKYVGMEGLRQFQNEKFPPSAVRLLHSFGTQGYSISPKGARMALQHCLPLRHRLIEFPDADVVTGDEGIDIALCGLYPRAKSFLCLPPLILPEQLILPSVVRSVREEIDRCS